MLPPKIMSKLKLYVGRKYIYYIIRFIITYTLLSLSKLDELDRKSLYYYVKISLMKSQYPLKTPLYIYINITFTIPRKTYYAKYTEGGIYGSYLYEFYPKLRVNMNNKLYWANTFKI